jgi:small subunit ribosomal protein S18
MMRGKKTFRPKLPKIGKGFVFNYLDPDLLRQFLSMDGKILPRRILRITAKQQRELTQAVKRARLLALLPFADTHLN